MKSYLINNTFVRETVHVHGCKISKPALEKLNQMLAQEIGRACRKMNKEQRVILQASDIKLQVPYVQMTFGSNRSAPETISGPESRVSTPKDNQETFVTC